MQSIKRLPRRVHGPLRSGIVLIDLPKVVEELVHNSVDAGATKVYVSVNISACYVKVEDDGCGITRDGLIILGEKYATSKFGLVDDIEASSGSLGFRGEALHTLSDISLVEVRTKARGKPNAYCKIIKGSKCLFVGIDDQREGVGTTVIVRDLFYNQPVRRRCMQSSPKKVLHSVKKCVLRTALVRPQISFKVTDIESEDVLLCTIPSSSPLSLVSDCFGNEVSSSLHEIVHSDHTLMLSGYISGPADAFSTKAFQYLYINSRFVSKGPVHNLVNSLAARFQGCLVQRVEPEFHRGKRLKTQGYPAYMFNLCCPPLSYDLSFEPSKTTIEFKEWGIVLTFFEKAIMQFWEQLQAQSLQGRSFAHKNSVSKKIEVWKEDVSKNSNTRRKRCNIQLHHCSLSHSPISTPLEIASEDITTTHGTSPKDLQTFSLEPGPCQSDTDFFGFTDCSLRHVINDTEDALDSRHDQMGGINNDPLWWTRDDSLPLENYLIPDLTPDVREKYDTHEFVRKNKTPNSTENWKEELINCKVADPHDIMVNAQEVHFPLHNPKSLSRPSRKESCPSMESEVCNSAFYSTPCDFGIKSVHLRKELDTVNALDADYQVESSSSRDIFCPQRLDASTPSFSVIRRCKAIRDFDVLSSDSIDPYSHDQNCLSEENNLHNRSEVWETGSTCQLPKEEWLLNSPHPLSARLTKFAFDSRSRDSLEWNLRSLKSGHPTIMEENVEFFNSFRSSCNEILPDESWAKTRSDHEYCSNPKRNLQDGHVSDEATFGNVCGLDNLTHETGSLFSNSSNVENNLHNRSEVWETGSTCQLPKEEWLLNSPHPLYARLTKFAFDSRSGNSLEWNLRSLKSGHPTIMEENEEFFNSFRSSYSEILPDESWAKTRSDHEYCSNPKRNLQDGYVSDETTFGNVCWLNKLTHETGWLFSDSSNVKRTDGCSKFGVHPLHNHDKVVERSLHVQEFQNHVLSQAQQVRSRRSSSAPPFYRGKCKSFILSDCLTKTAGKKPNFEFSMSLPETVWSLDNVSQSIASQKPVISRQEMKKSYAVGSITNEPEHVAAEMTKWRAGVSQPTDGDFLHNSFEQSDDILDISSGILHLSGSSLVPESIDKDCLEDARVLLQLDRKFIPVMASGTLIIIDQHAADERIRLEELRQKVLSGEAIGITYLDPVQELVLPEMGFQLLQKYAEQIQRWGWIYNTPSQPSESFAKNMNLFKRHACGVSLIAVPCILGINLTANDLIEFIEQLAETDGSSTLPPSVLRVLNFKACRGAIMFGDSLLPSECSLIVEELKATSLCFQCAHGRPTTAPLLHMAALHEELARLQVQQEGPSETWHGLRRHRSSIRRAQLRLDSARKFHSR